MDNEKTKENEKPNRTNSILRILLQGLITSLLTGLLIYYLTKQDNQINWCNNEIKNFDEKNYKSKDLSVLNKLCKDELLEYDLFSNLIYDVDHNETKHFGKTINKLLVDKKVDKQLIDDISMFKLANILNNKRFVYVDTYSNKKNDLFSVNKYIEKFLIFNNEIDFEKYKQEQLDNLFGIFSEIYKNEKLIRSAYIPRLNPPFEYDDKSFLENPIQLNNFMLFKQVMRKIDQNKVNIKDYLYTHTKFNQNSTNYKLQLIFNSYIFSNKKEELIQELINLFDIARSKKSRLTNEGKKLLNLILLELGDSYKLTKEELYSIYDSYSYLGNTNTMYFHYNKELIDQLVYNLKNERFILNDYIYTEYFVKKIKNEKYIFNNDDFIWFLSKKGARKLLIELFYSYKNNDNIQDNIFRAMILSSITNYNYIPNDKVTSNDILNLIKETKNLNQKNKYIKYSLYTEEYELILNAINHISSSKKYYKKQLDKVDHYDIVYNYFYLESIFNALSNAVPSYVGKQKEIKNMKIKLFINFIELTSSKDSKLELFKLLVNILKYNDLNLTKKIEKIINKEKDNIQKQNYINYFKDKVYNIKQKRLKDNYD